jgi:hypothetical protein
LIVPAGTRYLLERLEPDADEQLSKIVLFEDFSDDHINTRNQHLSLWLDLDPIRTASRAVSVELAQASARLPNLRHLSASFLVDACHFFQPLSPPSGKNSWANLASLSLTSRLLVPSQESKTVNDLLAAAAAMVIMMPQLNSMQLWNGRKGLAGVFRYQASPANNHQFASITWRATWNLELESRVTRAWEDVASKRRLSVFRVVKEMLDTGAAIKSHGDAIIQLGLMHDVIHPLSLSQIQREHALLD